jgi:anti-sigma factor RsiW
MSQLPSSIDDQLLDYLDGTLPAGERAVVEALMQHNDSVASRFEELRFMHVLMAGQKPEVPALDFTAKVMRGLDPKPAALHLSIRQAVFVVVGILAIIGIAAALVSAGVFDGMLTTVDLNRVAPSTRLFKDSLPAFSLNGKVIVNGIIFLNLALAFVVLDRAILRPFFQRRLQGGH